VFVTVPKEWPKDIASYVSFVMMPCGHKSATETTAVDRYTCGPKTTTTAEVNVTANKLPNMSCRRYRSMLQ
jgi:hypothetical protein